MEFTIVDNKDKHHVTVNKVTDSLGIQNLALHIDITRVRLNGGIPLTVRLDLEPTISFSDCMTKVNNVVHLEQDMYALVAQHTNKED